MKKIPTIFERDGKHLTFRWNPEARWVRDGEGVATAKYNGSACLVLGGELYRRRVVKAGQTPPPHWIHWNFDNPSPSGHGWLPITSCAEDAFHREAFPLYQVFPDGTYELVGPKLQGNPYKLSDHHLWMHGMEILQDVPRTYHELQRWFMMYNQHEGIVWHHPDGRMAKIKARDFGFTWPVKYYRPPLECGCGAKWQPMLPLPVWQKLPPPPNHPSVAFDHQRWQGIPCPGCPRTYTLEKA